MESQFIFCTKKRKRSDAVLINQQRHNGKYKANHCRNISLDSIPISQKKLLNLTCHTPRIGARRGCQRVMEWRLTSGMKQLRVWGWGWRPIGDTLDYHLIVADGVTGKLLKIFFNHYQIVSFSSEAIAMTGICHRDERFVSSR